MGQLLNRLFNFAKSELSSAQTGQSYIDNSDVELKRIIDELNKSKNDYKKETGSDSKSEKKQETHTRDMTVSDACSILGIQQSAAVDDIKSAFKKRVMEYHPDRVATLGPELKALAEKKTQQINEAYSIIRKLKGF